MKYVKKILLALMITVITLLNWAQIVFADYILYETQQEQEQELSLPELTLYAKSAVLMDGDSGRILYEKNGFEKMPNASTTKILTCIVAVESGKMEEAATVSSYAASMPKVRLGMNAGDQFYIKDLLYSLMLESHNDSAVVIAEHIGGTVEEFAAMMNEKAKKIGCENTYFITPNGLDGTDEEGTHGTTGADLALIMRYCIQNETFLEITRTPSYSFSNTEGTRSYSCNNHNAFLSMMEGALSGKTGFTGNAGYCYIGSLRQGERTFIVALLACGWPNNKTYKWSDTKQLMNYGLEYYNYEDVFEHEKELPDILVENGVPKSEKLHEEVIQKPVIDGEELKVLKGNHEQVTVEYDLPEKIIAPVKAGDKIGEVTYFLGGNEIAYYPIKMNEPVDVLNFKWYANFVFEQFLDL